MTSYRVRFVTDGGPATNPASCGHSHSSLFQALKCLARIRAGDPRVGVTLGTALQIRLFKSEPWSWISEADTQRHARDMKIDLGA